MFRLLEQSNLMNQIRCKFQFSLVLTPLNIRNCKSFPDPIPFTPAEVKGMMGKKAPSHSVYEVFNPGLEAVHLKAALDPLIGAHYGLANVPPAALQRAPACFTRPPETQVLHGASTGSIRYRTH